MNVAFNSKLSIAGNVVIARNSAKDWGGGGVYLDTNCTLRVGGNATITNNIVVKESGNLPVTGAPRGSDAPRESDGGNGGGVFASMYNRVSITENASITHNFVTRNGGGLAANSYSRIDISGNATINFNTASRGGGVYVDTVSNISVASFPSIRHNQASESGGGVYTSYNCLATITDRTSIVYNNSSRDGGGLFTDRDSHTRIGGRVLLAHNKAGAQGGCVSLAAYCSATLSGTFIHCTALLGGGLSVGPASSVYLQAAFNHNRADGLGDDVYAYTDVQLGFMSGSNIHHPTPSVYWQRTDCELGEVMPGRICEKCPSNMYSLNMSNRVCDICPSHAVCTGGDVVLPMEGFWHSSKYSTQMHKCPKVGACLTNGTCLAGHQGNLCGTCLKGYGKVGAFDCGWCRSVGVTLLVYILAWGLLVLFVAWLVYTTMHDNKQQTRGIRPSDLGKIVIRHVQYLLLLCSIRLPWPTTLVYLRNALAWLSQGQPLRFCPLTACCSIYTVLCPLLRRLC